MSLPRIMRKAEVLAAVGISASTLKRWGAGRGVSRPAKARAEGNRLVCGGN